MIRTYCLFGIPVWTVIYAELAPAIEEDSPEAEQPHPLGFC